MTRRRPPDCDYICRRCGCACNITGTRHLGGGSRDMRACKRSPDPILRADFEREIAADVAGALRARRLRWDNSTETVDDL
jgi:hypothetical protein